MHLYLAVYDDKTVRTFAAKDRVQAWAIAEGLKSIAVVSVELLKW